MKSHLNHSLIAALALAASLATAPGAHADWTADTTLLLGSKRFQDTDWAVGNSHKSIGLISDIGASDWPLRIAVDMFGTGREAQREGDRYDTFTGELDIGIRKVFDLPLDNHRLKPYLGAGVAMVFAEQDREDAGGAQRIDDTDTGYWIGTGARFELASRLSIGIDVRYSDSEVTLAPDPADGEIELGAVSAGLGIGLSW